MPLRWLAVPALLSMFAGSVLAAECPPLLTGSLPKLHAKDSIDLCQRYAGKPLVVVNTASFCGFAPQFKSLEALYQRYKGQGLEVHLARPTVVATPAVEKLVWNSTCSSWR